MWTFNRRRRKVYNRRFKGILEDVENGKLVLDGEYEDIHSFTEINLIQRIGDVGKKLHTARSRNDQVAVDMRLYAKEKQMIWWV